MRTGDADGTTRWDPPHGSSRMPPPGHPAVAPPGAGGPPEAVILGSMEREETADAAARRTVQPPTGSGIVVSEDADGTRITLPRLYSQSDVVLTVVSAAIAVGMAAWVDALAADPTASRLGSAFMAAIAFLFALLAVSQAIPIVAPRVIQDRGDRIVLSRAVGVRHVLPRTLPKTAIEFVDRVREEGEAETAAAGVVRIRTGRHTYRLGEDLDTEATAWLEDAVRTMAER